jgi:hypothetical protein
MEIKKLLRLYMGRLLDRTVVGLSRSYGILKRKNDRLAKTVQTQSDRFSGYHREIKDLRGKMKELEEGREKLIQERDELKGKADGLQAIIDYAPPKHRRGLEAVRRVMSRVPGLKRDVAKFSLDSVGHVIESEGSVLSNLGYSPEFFGISGSNQVEFYSLIHPDDVDELKEGINRAIIDESIRGFSFVIGLKYAGEILYAPYELNGVVKRREPDKRHEKAYVSSINLELKRRSVGFDARVLEGVNEIEIIEVSEGIGESPDMLRHTLEGLRELKRRAGQGEALAIDVKILYTGNGEVNGVIKSIFSEDRKVSLLRIDDDRIYSSLRELGTGLESLRKEMGLENQVKYKTVYDEEADVLFEGGEVEPI